MNGDFNRKLEFFIGATRRDLGEASKKLIEAVLEAKPIFNTFGNPIARCVT
jgi:hypothetical protein